MADAGAALPLTREQIDEWSASYAGVRVGTDCPMGPLFAQARAALDLADECARLRRVRIAAQDLVDSVSVIRASLDAAMVSREAFMTLMDALTAEPDRG